MDCHGLRERPWTTQRRSSRLSVLNCPILIRALCAG